VVQVEVVVASADLIPQPKPLSQRIVQPKAQPRSAAAVKQNGAGAKGGAASARGGKKTGRRGRSNRPVKKTAEELDSEMMDYFESGNTENNANNGAAPAEGGDAPMEEDVL
jgi:THO complex subunit 4